MAADAWTKFFTSILCLSDIFLNLLTNVLHCNTESFILLFHILFLKGSSRKQLTVAKVEYSMHLSVD